MKKTRGPVSVKAGHLEFLKLNTERYDWRDTYHLVLTLSWPQFGGLIFGIYILINIVFAALYWVGGHSIAEMPPGSFVDAFFFSVETLATVGYGHMYPDSLYGHIVATLEIITGMFGMAVVTGLIFVRFSRPTARVLFSKFIVIGPFDGVPALMLRVANLRHHAMVEAEFRVMLIRSEATKEDPDVRRFYTLKLDFDRLIAFPAALTIRHQIDETSPLYGLTAEDLKKTDARILASIVCVDTVIPAPIQSQVDYSYEEILWNRRFVEIYTEHGNGRFSVDYGRFHDTEDA
jgi:inward rectifier potassium channel